MTTGFFRTGSRYSCHVGGAIALIVANTAAMAAETNGAAPKLADWLTFDMRYRTELVEQDGMAEDAVASTLRTRLGLKSKSWHGWSAEGSVADIRVLGSERYNSTANGNTLYPVVADPEGTQLNQAHVAYRHSTGSSFKVGRQTISLDNERHFGAVAWRQNEQTFDAASLDWKLGKTTSIYVAHIDRVNRVFGDDNPNPLLAHTHVSAELLNIAVKVRGIKGVAYSYLVDNEDVPAASGKTIGARISGRHPANAPDKAPAPVAFSYSVEYAKQSAYRDGAASIDADYQLIEAGVEVPRLLVKAGLEVLSGDGAYAFSTPFATLHAFNGWADKFLTTPSTGLKDRYAGVETKLLGSKVELVYHDYAADAGGLDYGTELDLAASRKFGAHWSGLVKIASYDADGFATDTTKGWLQVQYRF